MKLRTVGTLYCYNYFCICYLQIYSFILNQYSSLTLFSFYGNLCDFSKTSDSFFFFCFFPAHNYISEGKFLVLSVKQKKSYVQNYVRSAIQTSLTRFRFM